MGFILNNPGFNPNHFSTASQGVFTFSSFLLASHAIDVIDHHIQSHVHQPKELLHPLGATCG